MNGFTLVLICLLSELMFASVKGKRIREVWLLLNALTNVKDHMCRLGLPWLWELEFKLLMMTIYCSITLFSWRNLKCIWQIIHFTRWPNNKICHVFFTKLFIVFYESEDCSGFVAFIWGFLEPSLQFWFICLFRNGFTHLFLLVLLCLLVSSAYTFALGRSSSASTSCDVFRLCVGASGSLSTLLFALERFCSNLPRSVLILRVCVGEMWLVCSFVRLNRVLS